MTVGTSFGQCAKAVQGFFQDKSFLLRNKKELSELSRTLNALYSNKKKHDVVVHYRRGNLEYQKKFSDYYEKIKLLIRNEKNEVLVVTESYNDAVVFFKNISNIKVISSKNALDDFKHLVSTKKLYCAPSTFSWWAAHSLEKNSEIIFPSYYKALLGVYINSEKLTYV